MNIYSNFILGEFDNPETILTLKLNRHKVVYYMKKV